MKTSKTKQNRSKIYIVCVDFHFPKVSQKKHFAGTFHQT